ncbi:MAG: type IV secretion system protein [Pseudomonadota bacterium]
MVMDDDAERGRVIAGFDSFALGGARLAFLVGTISSFAFVRLTAGLLLALAPLFAGFLLFERTRGLFEGWLRVLIGTAFGALGISVALGVELLVLEPWLSDMLTRRYANLSIEGFPVPLLATALIFNLVLLMILIATTRIALGLTLRVSGPVFSGMRAVLAPASSPANGMAHSPVSIDNRSRAAAIVDAVASVQRREGERASSVTVSNIMETGKADNAGAAASNGIIANSRPLGQALRRRTGTRVSARASFRDKA